MYIYDSAWGADNATSSHVERNPGTQGDIMINILDCLTAVNPYIPLYQQAHDMLRRQNAAKVYLQLAPPQGVDPHHYNLPSENEIAAILPGDNEHANAGRDLIVTLHLQNQQDAPRFQHIFETNFNYTPLMYVLLFPYGEPGWGPGIRLRNTGGLNDDADADEVQGLGEVLSLPLLKFNSYHSLIQPKTLMPTGEAMSQ